MCSQVVNVLTSFLAFFGFYIKAINAKVHNMLSIMLDKHEGHMRLCGQCSCYGCCKIWCSRHLNLVKTIRDPITLEDNYCFFGQIVFVDVVIMSTLKNELQIFLCLCVRLIETTNPLGWWARHLMQFPHVSFFACQVFDIIVSYLLLKASLMMLILGVRGPRKTH